MLHSLQGDIRFFTIQSAITSAIVSVDTFSVSQFTIHPLIVNADCIQQVGAVGSINITQERAPSRPYDPPQTMLFTSSLPPFIDNIDIITAEMDTFGRHAEAASIWRQMALMLRRSSMGLPAEDMFFLALATEQYGVYLAVCARPGEANDIDSEALAWSKH